MTDETVTPALKPWQWERRHLTIQAERYGDPDMPSRDCAAAEIKAGPDYLHITSHQHDTVAIIDTPEQRHALAALCLHQQPFGFTRKDVALLDAIAEHIAECSGAPISPTSVAALRARIAALLPPA